MDNTKAIARKRLLESLFEQDWIKLEFHGIIRRSQIEPVKMVTKNYETIHGI